MNTKTIKELSSQLKSISKDLSFLGRPRYNLRDLELMFPQHKNFIDCLEDIGIPFSVDINAKQKSIEDFKSKLSHSDIPTSMQKIFMQRAEDYESLLQMIGNFGNEVFYKHSVKLYGSSHEMIQNNSFLYLIEEIPKLCRPDESKFTLKGELAMDYLREKLAQTFSPDEFEVRPSSSLLSDSSAGRRTLKLNPHKEYSQELLDVFLVHEGWVHLGTSINGASHEDHSWIATWAPRTTFLQEGLAILVELITGHMTKERWNKVFLRHLATSMAERGSDIRDVYSYLRHHDMEELDAFKLSLRVFRGVPFDGGMAFTKELLYLHGLLEVLSFLILHDFELKDFWVGKVSFEELVFIKENLNLEVKHYPEALNDRSVEERLQKLKLFASN